MCGGEFQSSACKVEGLQLLHTTWCVAYIRHATSSYISINDKFAKADLLWNLFWGVECCKCENLDVWTCLIWHRHQQLDACL